MKFFVRCFDHILCASQYTADEFDRAAREKVSILNLGTNTDHFVPDKADPELRNKYLDGADILMLYVGRIDKEKNIQLLPEVMSRLEQRGIRARLLIAGTGKEAEAFKDACGSDVNFLGFVNDRELLSGIYASSDLFIFPSINEPYGLVPLEALAAGLPVVCADRGGVLEYSACEAVRSVAPTADDFADAVESLSGENRKKLAELARNHAEKFTWPKTFARQQELYKKLVTGYQNDPEH